MDQELEKILQPFVADRVNAVERAVLRKAELSALRSAYLEQLDRFVKSEGADELSCASADYHGAMYEQFYRAGVRDGLRLIAHLSALPLKA